MDEHIASVQGAEFSLSDDKPKLTYAQLIAEALSNASEGMLVLSDIYKAISFRHPYYKLENPNWQNSIRYQLTTNKSFEKAKVAVIGRGRYWELSNNLQGKLKKSVTTKEKTNFSTVFKCSICLEEYSERNDLNKHLSSVHRKKCPLCPAIFFTKKDMDQHITQAHITTLDIDAQVKSVHSIT